MQVAPQQRVGMMHAQQQRERLDGPQPWGWGHRRAVVVITVREAGSEDLPGHAGIPSAFLVDRVLEPKQGRDSEQFNETPTPIFLTSFNYYCTGESTELDALLEDQLAR